MKKENDSFQYDAFISYRHVPLDTAVAIRLQHLLENYRPPKDLKAKDSAMIRRVFRDQSELPASSDLRSAIRTALQQSRYLIVICSERLKESAWCMEEIRYFKELHQGRVDHILVLLVSGNAKEVIPDMLLSEDSATPPSNESFSVQPPKLSPLYVNIRSPKTKTCLQKLKTEFLRIAAPILGCSFDELFQRRQRQKRKMRAIISASTLALLSSILFVVSIFAYKAWVSEQKHRRMLSINYTSAGIQYASSGNSQEALLYFTEALKANPRESSAAAGVSFLLQEFIWPIFTRKEEGFLQYGQPLSLSVYAYDADSQTSLSIAKNFTFLVQNQNGETLFQSEEYVDLLGVHAGQWTFLCPDYSILFYNPIKDQCRSVKCPETISDGAKRGYEVAQNSQADALSRFDQSIFKLKLNKPDAIALSENRYLIAYGGIVYLYAPNGKNELEIIVQADLAKAFPDTAQRQLLSITNRIFISKDGGSAVIQCGDHTAVYDTETLTLKGSIENDWYRLTNIDVSTDGGYYAATYGNMIKDNLFNPGGYFAIYTSNSECIFTSPIDSQKPFSGIAFNDLNPDQVLVWGQDFAEIWDWKKGDRLVAPILLENIESAAFGDNGMILIDSGDDYVQYYELSTPLPQDSINAENIPILQKPQIQSDYAQLPEGLCLSTPKAEKLILTDEASGQTLSETTIPLSANNIALSENTAKVWVYDHSSPILGLVTIDYEKERLGKFREINTHGNIFQYIWFSGKQIIAETSEANLLIYDSYGNYKTQIQTQHSGYLDFLMISPNNNYLVAICSNKKQQTGTLTDKITTIEIWDLNSSFLIKSFEYEDTNINRISITPDGVLAWETTESFYSYQLEMPLTDKYVLDFLQGMCCCYFDKNQQILYKEPMQKEPSWGKWGETMMEWNKYTAASKINHTDTIAAAKDLTAQNLINDLASATDKGSEKWFDRCNSLWQDLLNGKWAYDHQNLASLYSCELSAGQTAQLAFGLNSYIRLTQDNVTENATKWFLFTNALKDTLAITTEYDDLISDTLCQVANVTFEHINMDAPSYDYFDTLNVESYKLDDRKIYYYRACYALAWSSLLNEESSPFYMELVCKASDIFKLTMVTHHSEPEIYSALLSGNPALAIRSANMTSKQIADYETNIKLRNLYIAEWFRDSEILKERGLITQSTLDDFLHGIDFDFGMKVIELPVKAQQTDLQLGDLVIGVNGTKIMSAPHWKQLKNVGETLSLEVVRDGKHVFIDVPGEITFYVNWVFETYA